MGQEMREQRNSLQQALLYISLNICLVIATELDLQAFEPVRGNDFVPNHYVSNASHRRSSREKGRAEK